MAAEWPLSGTQVDPGEFYLKASHEYLWSFMPGDHDLEVRLAPVIGFEISKRNEVEAGIEHRLSRFIDSTPRQRTWLTLGWFHSISR